MSGAPSCCAAQIRPSTKPGCSGEKKQGPGQAPRSLPTCRHRRLTARDKPLLAAKHLSPSTVAAALRHHCAVPKLPWPLLAKAPATTSGARRRARGSCPANQRSRRARPWWVAQTEPRLTDGRRAGQPCLVTLGPELLCVGQPQAPGLHPRQAAVSAVSAARPPAQPPSSLPSVIPSNPAALPAGSAAVKEMGTGWGAGWPSSQPRGLSPAGVPGAEPGGATTHWLSPAPAHQPGQCLSAAYLLAVQGFSPGRLSSRRLLS